MFLGEYQLKLCGGKVRFPYNKEEVSGFYCYLLGYDDNSHGFITLAADGEKYNDGDVILVKKLPLAFDGEYMMFSDEMISHLSLKDDTVVFCGVGEFIDIMSEDEYDKGMEYNADLESFLKSII